MKTTNRHVSWNWREAVSAVREMIGREFPSLQQHQPRILQLALNEAEAIAWQTGYPHLVFPALAMEKLRDIAAWHERQEALRRRHSIQSFAA